MSYSFAKLYLKSNRSIGIAFWHFQFNTKYRYKMFSKSKYKSLILICSLSTIQKQDLDIQKDIYRARQVYGISWFY